MVSATTRLHCDDAGRQTAGKLDDTHPMHTPTNDDAPAIIQSHDAAAILAQVNPKNLLPRSIPRIAICMELLLSFGCPASVTLLEEGRAIP
jgi:hypothetical protein